MTRLAALPYALVIGQIIAATALCLAASACNGSRPGAGRPVPPPRPPAPSAASLALSLSPTPPPDAAEAPLIRIRGRRGYWRVAEDGRGVWWFVSPQGSREFLNLVTTVQPFLLARGSAGGEFLSHDFNPRDLAGDNPALARWARATADRVLGAGFKGVGAWSNPALHAVDIPMAQDLNLTPALQTRPTLPFDADWADRAERVLRPLAAPLRNNRSLIGYYTDNELDWTGGVADPATCFDGLSPGNPNRRAVIGAIQSLWPTIDQFNRDWGQQLGDWSALDQMQRLPREPQSSYDELSAVWRGRVADHYFQTTSRLIRAIDPNHLLLGCRYRGSAPAEVIAASAKYLDAQSINYYAADARLDAADFSKLEGAGLPVIVSEYSFHATDGRSGDRNSVAFPAQVFDQQARADGYRLFTARLASVPYLIGADWFQWMDEPPTGRRQDGEDVNFGIVDVDDRPYDRLVAAVRETGPRLDALHARAPDHPAAQGDVWRRDFTQTLPTATIPRLAHPIKLDGRLDDWPAGARLGALRSSGVLGAERSGLAPPNVWVGWRPDGLYLGLEIFDRDVESAPADGAWWAGDSVEFWISTRPVPRGLEQFNSYCSHFFYVPGAQDKPGVVGRWHSPGDAIDANQIPAPGVRSAQRILADRYLVEIVIPAGSLPGYDPLHEPTLAFNVYVRNAQHGLEYDWSAPKLALTQRRPDTWGVLRLDGAEKP